MVPLMGTVQFKPNGAQGTLTVPETVSRLAGAPVKVGVNSWMPTTNSVFWDSEFPTPYTKLPPEPGCTDSLEAASSETAEDR